MSKIRVLSVDDSALMRQIMTEIIKPQRYGDGGDGAGSAGRAGFN